MEGNEQIGHLQVLHPLIQRVKCSFGSVRFILLKCSYPFPVVAMPWIERGAWGESDEDQSTMKMENGQIRSNILMR